MKRRNFLSLLSCAALSSVVPRPVYFFMNGLMRPDADLWTPPVDAFKSLSGFTIESDLAFMWKHYGIKVNAIWFRDEQMMAEFKKSLRGSNDLRVA